MGVTARTRFGEAGDPMEHGRRKRRLPDPPFPAHNQGAGGLGPIIGLLFLMLVIVAGYLALIRAYEEQAGDYNRPTPPKTATPQSSP
jgi:hypothetical protein